MPGNRKRSSRNNEAKRSSRARRHAAKHGNNRDESGRKNGHNNQGRNFKRYKLNSETFKKNKMPYLKDRNVSDLIVHDYNSGPKIIEFSDGYNTRKVLIDKLGSSQAKDVVSNLDQVLMRMSNQQSDIFVPTDENDATYLPTEIFIHTDNEDEKPEAIVRLMLERINTRDAVVKYGVSSHEQDGRMHRFEVSHDVIPKTREQLAAFTVPASSRSLWNRWNYYRTRKQDKELQEELAGVTTNTASQVFKAKTKGPIGKSGTTEGYAKRAYKRGDVVERKNGLAIDVIYTNVNSVEREDNALHGQADGTSIVNVEPRMIARQVLSYRVAEALGVRVITPEVFSKTEKKQVIGISAKVDGLQMVENLADGTQQFNEFDLENAKIQRGLSDLQLMDAICGQQDRHLGNIFINPFSGEVTGIDNDMAFPIHEAEQTNDNSLRDQFERVDDKLVYKQQLVDVATAEKILNMNTAKLKKILKGRKGDPERLEKAAISHAVERFEAVQNQVSELKKNNQLIGQGNSGERWGEATLKQALDMESDQNYLARAVEALPQAEADVTLEQAS